MFMKMHKITWRVCTEEGRGQTLRVVSYTEEKRRVVRISQVTETPGNQKGRGAWDTTRCSEEAREVHQRFSYKQTACDAEERSPWP